MTPELREKLERLLNAIEQSAKWSEHWTHTWSEQEPWERRLRQARIDLMDLVGDALDEAERRDRVAS